MSGEEVSINIRCSNGSKFEVKTELNSTVRSFKSLISRFSDIPADHQRLIYEGRILKDHHTLLSYGLESDDTVHLVRGFVPASSPQTTGASNNVTLNHTPSGVGVGSDDVASLFPSLNINGLGGRTGLFDTGLPQFEEMQQPPTQNPNLMSEVMNTPELAHVLNDSSTLRQLLETARNPELMRQMMRNTDRATSNIESSPEGFNMLRRMYENVQEPFLNATTMNGVYRNDLGSNPSTGLLDTQGGGQEIDNPMSGAPVPNSNPLPNPWASGATGNAQGNATTRSSPAGLESMFDSMPDNASFEEFLQNPAMPQMIQTVPFSPEYMNQVIGVAKQVEEPRPITDQKRPRPQKEQALNCPRCNSTTTEFCYYDNYSLTQPRYFCKTCRRYWTEGGTLRTVPVGGGSRKNKRSISSSISSQAQSSSKKLLDHATSASVSRTAAPPNPITYDGQDLNLGYSPMTSYDQYNKTMELLKTGSIPSMGLNPLMLPMSGSAGPNPMFPPEYPLQEYKPTLNFSLNGINQNGYANLQDVQETTPRIFFPFNDLKQPPNSNDEMEQHRRQGEANGYWSGMLNGGSW